MSQPTNQMISNSAAMKLAAKTKSKGQTNENFCTNTPSSSQDLIKCDAKRPTIETTKQMESITAAQTSFDSTDINRRVSEW